ncbi:hypothetical protein CSB45_07295 [candidate division KSB3 bacterium]|uniref:Uncharacterized protein n=1 Tax=candidate division KSB3 bacterium TaxID=2044937 RepID=A0A2G6E6V4_9BACT|nr:MAG: hypothetical protein CSB45_07295 [candidate division KSB3 bacterium]
MKQLCQAYLAVFTVVALAVMLIPLAPRVSEAHSPVLLVEDNEDGTILVMAGFSNGKMAAGKTIQLKSQASGAVLWEGTLDENSEVLCPKQTEPYSIFFDGGPGHSIEKAGPLPKEGETVSEVTSEIGEAKTSATTCASLQVGEAVDAISPDSYQPLSKDFDDEIKALLPADPLLVKDASGVVRPLRIQESYQYHHLSGMKQIMAMLEKKKAAGKQVDIAIRPVGLCLGVTTGYLALEFAIRELYGDEVPEVQDFVMSTKTKMGGVWDTWDLYFGRRLAREDAEFGIAPKAYVFTAEQPSNGHKVIFTYNQSLAEDIKHLGAAKKSPEKFPEKEFQRAKKSFITGLLTQRADGDFGYFEVIEKNF